MFLAAGCAHSQKPASDGHEVQSDYDWSQFKGGSDSSSASSAKSDDSSAKTTAKSSDSKSSQKQADSTPPADPVAAADPMADTPAPKAAVGADKSEGSLPHKASKAKVHGASVSSIDADTLAAASKGALKAKVMSSSIVVGPDYEMVQVVLKGASVQIVRPAATPDPQGPKLRSPKTRNDAITGTESGYYDADADVIVLVRAAKQAKAKKALSALVQH